MKKILRKKWYISVIVAGLYLYSLVCWGKFVGHYASKILSATTIYAFAKTESAVTGDSANASIYDPAPLTDSKGLLGEINSIFERLDSGINKLDSRWGALMPGKNKLSQADSILTYFSTGEVLSGQVVLGEDNWLFYKSQTDADSISDYEGTNLYSEDELNSILTSAIITQQQIEDKGIQFAIIVAPNKENVYSEFMPKTYVHAERTRTDILVDFLQNNGVHVAYPKEELLNNSDLQLYFKYDTHWNQFGAYIGVQSVLAQFKIDIPDLKYRTTSSTILADNYRYCGEDDLAKMVGLREVVFNNDLEYKVNGTIDTDWAQVASDASQGKVSHFTNDEAEIHATVLLVGDSFRTSMLPELQEVFTDVYVIHRSAYKSDLIDEINPDYFIAEYVERYSSEIEEIDALVN